MNLRLDWYNAGFVAIDRVEGPAEVLPGASIVAVPVLESPNGDSAPRILDVVCLSPTVPGYGNVITSSIQAQSSVAPGSTVGTSITFATNPIEPPVDVAVVILAFQSGPVGFQGAALMVTVRGKTHVPVPIPQSPLMLIPIDTFQAPDITAGQPLCVMVGSNTVNPNAGPIGITVEVISDPGGAIMGSTSGTSTIEPLASTGTQVCFQTRPDLNTPTRVDFLATEVESGSSISRSTSANVRPSSSSSSSGSTIGSPSSSDSSVSSSSVGSSSSSLSAGSSTSSEQSSSSTAGTPTSSDSSSSDSSSSGSVEQPSSSSSAEPASSDGGGTSSSFLRK